MRLIQMMKFTAWAALWQNSQMRGMKSMCSSSPTAVPPSTETQILAQKQEEARRANALLGVKAVHFGALPDMRLDTVSHVEVNQLIEETVDTVAPEVVYTHFYGDVNLDHQMVYRSTLVAVRPVPGQTVRELYCYRVPSSTEWSPQLGHTVFLPNTMVDISDYTARKEAALLAYQTEERPYPHPRSAQYVRETDRTCGLQWGMGSARPSRVSKYRSSWVS